MPLTRVFNINHIKGVQNYFRNPIESRETRACIFIKFEIIGNNFYVY